MDFEELDKKINKLFDELDKKTKEESNYEFVNIFAEWLLTSDITLNQIYGILKYAFSSHISCESGERPTFFDLLDVNRGYAKNTGIDNEYISSRDMFKKMLYEKFNVKK